MIPHQLFPDLGTAFRKQSSDDAGFEKRLASRDDAGLSSLGVPQREGAMLGALGAGVAAHVAPSILFSPLQRRRECSSCPPLPRSSCDRRDEALLGTDS